jgi:GTP-binding protein HflX
LVSKKGEDKNRLEESFREMRELVRSALGNVVEEIAAPLQRVTPRYYVGEGKLAEIAFKASGKRIGLIIFNIDLSPTQARNIEEVVEIARVVDRTGLILDIFAQRARSKEGRLQVELAQLQYLFPRLAGRSPELSRLGGGIGTRGPGEMKLEVDRRKIRTRIQKIEEELGRVETHRKLLRTRRKSNRTFTVSLVGYTNAGKSTLINALTHSEVYVADKLFATLDPTTRVLQGKPTEPLILFTDTVGFISSLPHELIEAFHATLEEVREADLLLHVVDGASPYYEDQMKVVQGILENLGCKGHDTFLVFNKKDLIPPVKRASLLSFYPQGFLLSALNREGLKELQAEIVKLAVEKFAYENSNSEPD